MLPVSERLSDRTDTGLLLGEKTYDDGNIMEDAVSLLPCSCSCAGDEEANLPPELRGDSMQIEELWRSRYKVRPLYERVDNRFEDDSMDSCPRAPTLLNDLWS